MASEISNQSLPAWSQRVPGRNGPLAFVKPDVSTVTLPGNPPGLFPRASLDAGIPLEVTAWATLPPVGETETVTLQIARAPKTSSQVASTGQFSRLPAPRDGRRRE